MNKASLFTRMDPSSFHASQSEIKDSFQLDYTKSEEEDFDSNCSQSPEENCERLTEVVKKQGDPPIDRHQDKFRLTIEQKAKMIAQLRWKRSGPLIGQSAEKFKKATDANLQDAAKFIDQTNIPRIATRFLGLTLTQISDMDGFSVLKLWRDAMPYQGSKEVPSISNAF